MCKTGHPQQSLHHMMQQGNKTQLHSNVNQLGIGPLNKSPNLQSPPQSIPNTLGMNSMNSLPMSIANNGTQPMNSMQGMHAGVQGSGVGGMIMTNSNMGSMGNVQMAGGGLVVKQQGGNMMMNPNSMQPNNQQGMHHPVHQNSLQNGPMGMARMNMQQPHMPGMQRGILNQHMINSQRMVVQQQQVGQSQLYIFEFSISIH